MNISHPATVITDYILAVFGLIFGISLLRLRSQNKPSTILWSIGFLTGAVAGITGGTYHGLMGYSSETTLHALWNVTFCSIGATAGFMISAALTDSLDSRKTRWLRGGLVLSIIGLLIQQSGLSVHASFNHNDLYHCIQTLALYLFFRGAHPAG